ncbi:MAG: nodulation protein NodZ, partial [Cyanobacteria bacterium J06632_22]
MQDQYLLLKGYAGLGNRIAALVTAILYAKLSKRTLVVDWRDDFYSSDGRNVFDALFQTQSIPIDTALEILDQAAISIAPDAW